MTELTETIQAKIVDTRFHTRHGCSACGGAGNKYNLVCRVTDGPYAGFTVCEDCLKSDDLDAQLEATAAALIERGMGTRALIGRLRVPTWAEWQAAVAEEERQVQEYYDADARSRGFKDHRDESNHDELIRQASREQTDKALSGCPF